MKGEGGRGKGEGGGGRGGAKGASESEAARIMYEPQRCSLVRRPLESPLVIIKRRRKRGG